MYSDIKVGVMYKYGSMCSVQRIMSNMDFCFQFFQFSKMY